MNNGLICCTLLILAMSFGPSKAETRIWDQSCASLERAYAMTRSTDFYSTRFYAVKPDGAQELAEEARFAGPSYFTRDTAAKPDKWIKSQRPGWVLWSNGTAKFSDCNVVEEDVADSKLGRHYTAKWSRHPYAADTEIWLSQDNSRLAKVLSRDTGKIRLHEFVALLEEFDFNLENAAPPLVYEIAQSEDAD